MGVTFTRSVRKIQCKSSAKLVVTLNFDIINIHAYGISKTCPGVTFIALINKLLQALIICFSFHVFIAVREGTYYDIVLQDFGAM